MKKLLTICLTLVMALTMSVTVFAAPGGFVSSPSGNPAPEIVDYSNSDEDCTAKLVLTPYSKRGTLEDKLREQFEAAYNSIVNTTDLSKLNSELTKIAEELNTTPDKLAVSDLFDINYTDCDVHEEHGTFTIKLKAETLKNFAALMRFDGENWVIVEGAKVLSDGIHLTFASEELGPFAIVVNNGESSSTEIDTDTPQTGDAFPWIYVILISASLVGLVVVAVVYVKSKKA